VQAPRDDGYKWLNDMLAVGSGEVRCEGAGGTVLVIDWHAIVWEPIAE
jgi:hypothetical protein